LRVLRIVVMTTTEEDSIRLFCDGCTYDEIAELLKAGHDCGVTQEAF
jgi:DNA-binding CsgD family transcriptional regulator